MGSLYYKRLKIMFFKINFLVRNKTFGNKINIEKSNKIFKFL